MNGTQSSLANACSHTTYEQARVANGNEIETTQTSSKKTTASYRMTMCVRKSEGKPLLSYRYRKHSDLDFIICVRHKCDGHVGCSFPPLHCTEHVQPVSFRSPSSPYLEGIFSATPRLLHVQLSFFTRAFFTRAPIFFARFRENQCDLISTVTNREARRIR